MEGPISPPPVAGGAGRELPAYLSNGVVGLKVRDNPLSPGMTLRSGFSGEHPERKVEAAAFAPYPIAGDVNLNGVWMSEASQYVRIVDQAYDFSTGELTTRLIFKVRGHQAKITVMAFCSREQPTIVCQEVSIEVDTACEIRIRAKVDLRASKGEHYDTTVTHPPKPNHRATARCYGRARGQCRHAALLTSPSCEEMT
jgi:trehalose/maltose hydrolase-like predicted phosphorylase